MRALPLGIPALMLTLMAGAGPGLAQSYPWCARSATGSNCGFETLEQCTMTTRAEAGGCEKNPMYKPTDQPLTAQEESAPPPPAAADRKQDAMPQASRQRKLQTCQFGAKDQKLTGGARKTFMSRCLASDDGPPPKRKPQPKKPN
jgi:hypothetical protein